MISTQAAPDAFGTVVDFDRHSRGRLDGRAGVGPAVRVLVADGQALGRAGFRALLEAGGRISVVGEASTATRRSCWLVACALTSCSST